MTRPTLDHKEGLRESRWVLAGICLAFGTGMASLELSTRVFSWIDRSAVQGFVYANAGWLGIATLAIAPFWFWLFYRLPERPWRHVPPAASWWKYVLFGFGIVVGPGTAYMLALFGTVTVTIVLPIVLIREYILGPGASLVAILAVIPVAFLLLGLTVCVVHVMAIVFQAGSLASTDGTLLGHREEGGTGGGTSDLVNLYFYSCFSLLGGDFADYRATGACRAVTLGSVILGRVLEVAVIAAGINLLVAR